MIKSVLVPLDGSELAEEALGYAVPIAERHNASLHFVFVIRNDADASEDDEARSYLKEVAARLGRDAKPHVRIGNAADQIIEADEELEDPLIVMTTHGRTGVGRWIYGSVADKVVHASESPVLLLRSGAGKLDAGGIQTIIVALDGSAYAEAALNWAKSMAKTFDAELHVVRVAETASLYSALGYETYAPGAGQPMSDIVEQMVTGVRKYISEVTAQLKDEGYRVQGIVLEGFAGEELLGYERKVQPELTVMATRSRTGFERFMFGSVAERFLKSGQTPVLMYKPSGALDEEQ